MSLILRLDSCLKTLKKQVWISLFQDLFLPLSQTPYFSLIEIWFIMMLFYLSFCLIVSLGSCVMDSIFALCRRNLYERQFSCHIVIFVCLGLLLARRFPFWIECEAIPIYLSYCLVHRLSHILLFQTSYFFHSAKYLYFFLSIFRPGFFDDIPKNTCK